MNIIVVGCGKIGSTLVESLSAEGHDVVALEKDAHVLEQITNMYDVMGVCGNGADCETLEEAAVDKAELVVAATGSDEMNMLCCFFARKMGAKHTIARVRNPEYNDRSLGFMRQQLNLSMSINPELLTAQELFNILKVPSAVKIEYFSGRNFEMAELRLREDSILDGIRLIDLQKKYHTRVLICAVRRGEQVFIPDGNFVLHGGDKISLTASPAEVQKLLKRLGVLRKQARDVMILGGSRTAFYLAKMLSNTGNNVKIIDQNRARCRNLCEVLPNAVIINGDGSQQELLLEEGLRSMDAFVALTGIDEENILMSLFAASQNVPKVISKVNRNELGDMAEKLGLDCLVSPKDITSDVVVRYARALRNSQDSNMETMYKIMDGKAEALEFKVCGSSAITQTALKDLALKPNTLIAGIIRGRKTIIPTGEDKIMPGDKVVVLAANRRLHDLTDIIK